MPDGNTHSHRMRAIAYGAAAVAGLGYTIALPPWNLWPVAWLSLIPLMLVVRRLSITRTVACAWFAGWVFAVVSGFWTFKAPQTALGTSPWAAGSVLVFAAGPLCGIAVPIAAVVAEGCARSWIRLPRIAGWPLGWAVGELVRQSGPIAMPWSLYGVTQVASLPMVQTVALGGTGFLSVVVVACNAAGAEFVVRRRLTWGALALGIPVITYAGGWLRLANAPDVGHVAPGAVHVAVIQGNFPQAVRLSDDAVLRHAYERQHVLLSQRALCVASPDVIVWPETSAGSWAMDYDRIGQDLLDEIAASCQRPATLIAGITVVDRTADSGRASYFNAAFSRSTDGAFRLYRKRRLVPFAERIPPVLMGMDVFGMRSTLTTSRTPGPEPPAMLGYKGRDIGAMVCYEFLYPRTLRSTVRAGADWLAVVTNDGWYDGSKTAVDQHHAQASLAAIAAGRTLIRANNTGWTGGFDPWGRPLQFERAEVIRIDDRVQQPVSRDEVDMFRDVETRNGRLPRFMPAWGVVAVVPGTSTPFLFLGAWAGWISFGILLVLAFIRLSRQLRQQASI